MSDNPVENEPIIICKDVHKWYGHFEALCGVSLTVEKGEVLVIFGPSAVPVRWWCSCCYE